MQTFEYDQFLYLFAASLHLRYLRYAHESNPSKSNWTSWLFEKARAICSDADPFSISIRHVTLGLKPGSRMNTFMVATDCSDDRKRIPYTEPVPCNHTPEEIAEARKALGEPDLEEFPHKHFRRKHPWRIELDLDPTCHVTELRVVAPSVCTDRYRPIAPRVRLDF